MTNVPAWLSARCTVADRAERVDGGPAVSDAGLVLVTDDGIVVVLDPDTGQPVTEPFELPDMDVVNGFAVDGSTLYVTAEQTAPDLQRDARVVLWGIDLDAL